MKGQLGKVLIIDFVVTAAFSLLFFTIGMIYGRNLSGGLEAIKNGLFFIASMLLFLLAGMFLVKAKSGIIGSKRVIGLTAAVFLAVASVVDFYIR